jgi:hypothetical protein
MGDACELAGSFVVEGSGDGRRLIGVGGDPDSADRYIFRKK